MPKSRDAFRTISEVAEALDTPAHVLRFWESKFTQIKPVKRAGGRRYYRPDDINLLAGIKTLLHVDGVTIKGAQKILREKGIKHVATLVPSPLDKLDHVEAEPHIPNPALQPTPAAATPPPAPERPAPPKPAAIADVAPRPTLLDAVQNVRDDRVTHNSAQIKVLFQRLDDLHAKMRVA